LGIVCLKKGYNQVALPAEENPIMNPLLETWQINARITLYVLGAVAPEALKAGKALKLRTVAAQFAHIHNVRLMWLKEAAPDLLEGLDASGAGKFDLALNPDATELRTALDASAGAISVLLERGLESGKIRGFKPHATAFLGYLIAHESYHRAEIGIILTHAGHPLEKKVAFGMWEWGVR